MLRSAFLLALLVAVAGCDATEDEFVALPVVSSVLIVGEELPEVRLRRLAPLNSTYDPAAQAINGAEVTVTLVGIDGTDEQTIPYVSQRDGRYVPHRANTYFVQPGRTYRLVAVVPSVNGVGMDTLRAETLVPPAITIVEPPPAEITYGEGLGPAVRLTTSSTAERRAVYLFTARATARDEFDEVTVDGETRWRQRGLPGRFGPIPASAFFTFADCEIGADGLATCESDPAEFDNGASPLLNEDNYEILPDGTARVTIPFIGVGFYGPQAITFHSLDDALVRFVQTQSLQANPTTISPGEVPNVTTNVENGLGVFGSLARATVTTFVREP